MKTVRISIEGNLLALVCVLFGRGVLTLLARMVSLACSLVACTFLVLFGP